MAGWLSMQMLHAHQSEEFIDRVPPGTYSKEGVELKSTRFAGRTMDLTLFALSRAADVLIGELWAQRKARRVATDSWSKLDAFISKFTDPSIFATSCAFIMWAWVYLPERLNKGYGKWITGAANIDNRLLVALQRARWGEFLYGTETGQGELLVPMCKEYGWPEVWGEPGHHIPLECEMVHMGTGPNCEYHALSRFARGFSMAVGLYLPINLAVQVRNPSAKNLKYAVTSALRSSAFLGSFIAIFYYGVCLARTRVGPLILGTSNKARQQLDSGLCIASGCALCGWSLLIENASRRKDIALFVAPRALAVVVPRRYEVRYQWRETVVFAASAAVVFTCVQENPQRVRGVLGRLLERVLVP